MKISELNSIDYKILKEKYGNLDIIKDKLNDNYPIQYLIGNVDFDGFIIDVDERVLIPRFETEGLVEKTLYYLKEKNLINGKVLEIGTGSGCISIALKGKMNSLDILAIDNSIDALNVAKNNAKNNHTNIKFLNNDLFDYNPKDKFDIIISNPPYITYGDEVSSNTKYEPYHAIYVDGNPLKYYQKILELGLSILDKNFLIALEIDEEQGNNLLELAQYYYPNCNIILEKDLANKDRYLFIMNK